ncbi:MAG: type IV toxin-antitoxin system AbiEi family antitoxin domain-containing protein [Solirubrobacteraceae bacterium]
MGAESDIPGRNHHPRRGWEPWPQLVAQANRQAGVVSRDQLLVLGFSERQINWRVDRGLLSRIHHNVYVVGHRLAGSRGYLVAALLSAGPDAFLSHRTAAAVWGLRPVDVRRLELTVPGSGGRHGPAAETLIVHRTRHTPHVQDVRLNNQLRVSSVGRLLVELANRETPIELSRLVTEAVRRRLLRLEAADGRQALEDCLARHRRYPGMAKLSSVLAAYRRPESARSGLERAFDRFLDRHPEIPEPQRNIQIGRWEIDRYWPDHRLAVELDGRPYHRAVQDMERDRVKDADLQRLGHIPIRFTDFRFEHDLPGILRDLHHFLGIGPRDRTDARGSGR